MKWYYSGMNRTFDVSYIYIYVEYLRKLTWHSLRAQQLPSGIYLPRRIWTSKLGLRMYSPSGRVY